MIRAALIVAMAWAAFAVHPHSSEVVKVAGVAAVAALLLPGAIGALPRLPALTMVAAVVLLTSSFALEPAVWVGSNARGQGALLAMALTVLAAAASLQSAAERRVLRRAAALLGGVVGAHALLQYAGLDPMAWRGQVDGRPMATLSNATTLAGLLLLVLPATVAAALEATRGRWLWVALALLQFAALLASGTRSALAALGIAAIGAWALVDARSRRRALLLLAIAGLAVIALAAWRPASLQDRAFLWRTAATALTAPAPLQDLHGHVDAHAALRPWLGYGLDQQQPALSAAAASTPGARGEADGWVADRAHQGLLDRALEMGVAGLLVALLLVLAVQQALWSAWRSGDADLRREAVLLGIALGAWLIHLQASFALTGDRTLAWVWIGMALALGRGSTTQAGAGRGAAARGWQPLALRSLGVIAGAGLLIGALAAVGALPADVAARVAPALRAEREYAAGQSAYLHSVATTGPDAAGEMAAAALAFERAVDLRRHDRDAALAAASARVELAAMTASTGDLAAARAWAEAARRLSHADPRLAALDARIEAVATRIQPRDPH